MPFATDTALAYMGRCRKCKAPARFDVSVTEYGSAFVVVNGERLNPFDRDNRRECRSCGYVGALAALKSVRGTYRPEVACTARCTTATRPDCECSCAGRNHGSDHG